MSVQTAVANHLGDDQEPAPTVLLVDDDERLCALTAEFLSKHGLQVIPVADGAGLDATLAQRQVDVVILDVMLPGEDGLSICRRLAALPDPRPAVIMLSAAGDDIDRIVGLELGADDYLAKPANPRELLARVRALLRRSKTHESPSATAASPPPPDMGYEFSGWTLSVWTRELQTPDGVLVPLTTSEFALLKTFLEHPRRILTRDQLLNLVRGRESYAFDRAVDVQVSRLRRKFLAADPEAGDLVRTVRNEGYMFVSAVKRL